MSGAVSAVNRGAPDEADDRVKGRRPAAPPDSDFPSSFRFSGRRPPVADGLLNPEGMTIRVCSGTAGVGLDRITLKAATDRTRKACVGCLRLKQVA